MIDIENLKSRLKSSLCSNSLEKDICEALDMLQLIISPLEDELLKDCHNHKQSEENSSNVLLHKPSGHSDKNSTNAQRNI